MDLVLVFSWDLLTKHKLLYNIANLILCRVIFAQFTHSQILKNWQQNVSFIQKVDYYEMGWNGIKNQFFVMWINTQQKQFFFYINCKYT